jgi:hypothetical protein
MPWQKQSGTPRKTPSTRTNRWRIVTAQNSFTETNRSPFPTLTVRRSLFSFGFSLSFFVPFFGLLSIFFFFLLSFFDLPHHGTGKWNREAAA